jgi:hypothetical protein
MAGPEAKMRQAVLKALRTFRWHAVAVDNEACHRGTPDVSYCGAYRFAASPCAADKVEGWTELKQLPKWPKLGEVVKISHFTPQQRIWLRQRWEVGGASSLLLRVGSSRKTEWLLFEGPTAAMHVGRVSQTSLYGYCLAHHTGPLSSTWLVRVLAGLDP